MVKYRKDIDTTARGYVHALYLMTHKRKAVDNLLSEYEGFNERKVNSCYIDCKHDLTLKPYYLEGYKQSVNTIYD